MLTFDLFLDSILMEPTAASVESELLTVKHEVTTLQSKLSNMESMITSTHMLLISQSKSESISPTVPNSLSNEESRKLGDFSDKEISLIQTHQSILNNLLCPLKLIGASQKRQNLLLSSSEH